MLDTRVQVDLVGLSNLLEDLLAAVALVAGEDGIGLGGGDRQRSLETAELVLVNKGGVGHITDLDAVRKMACDVLRREKGQRVHHGLVDGWDMRTLAPKQ